MDSHYGFYGRLTAEFPSQIVVDTTEVCNLACIHCPHEKFKRSTAYGGNYLDPELNKKIVDEVAEYGKGLCQYLRYSGDGEPLLHKSIFEMLKYAVDNSGTTVTLTINGTLLSESKVEELLATGVHIVYISIDAFLPETYAKIRVNGDLNVTRANVLNLINQSKKNGRNTKVVVSYIEQDANKSETKDFESFWKAQGADYVVIRYLHSNAGIIDEQAEKMRSEQQGISRRPCLYPWERIVLTPKGFLSFCPAGWMGDAVVSDYRTSTVHEIWKSQIYEAIRQAHLNNDFSVSAKLCGTCPDWKVTRWPDEGRCYADMVQDFKNKE